MPPIDDRDVAAKVDAYYTKKIEEHGATPRGVDWNSEESQVLRFKQILKIIDPRSPYSITDYGCGYGALALHLLREQTDFRYHGVDVSEAMVAQAKRLLGSHQNCTVSRDLIGAARTDYTVASGIFSVRMDVSEDAWLKHCLETIDVLAQNSSAGFSFNMLTAYSDKDRMRPDLYYADPHFIFDFCRERYSRFVALLHDYPLYEFTILVRFQRF